jgi:hypothetical protein
VTAVGAALTLRPSVFIIISAQRLKASCFISASNQLGAERADARNFVSPGPVQGGSYNGLLCLSDRPAVVLLCPLSKVVPEKLMVVHLVRKNSNLYGARMHLTVCKSLS